MRINYSNVCKNFQENKILSNINLSVEDGDIMLIVGRNGAGKTTLLRLLLGIYTLEQGEIQVDGISVKSQTFSKIKDKIGFLNDNLGLFRDLTAWDNIEFFYRIYQPNVSKRKRDEDITRVMKKVELFENRNKKIDFFSRGMKQRLAIARAIVNDPRILILDEPHRGLDVEGKEMVKEIVSDYAKQGVTTIVNSHDLNDMQEVVTHVAFLNKGKIVCNGSYQELSEEANAIKYRLVVLDSNNVFKLLQRQHFVKNIQNKDDAIVVEVSKGGTELRTWLNSNHIEVLEIAKINQGLTELYKKYIC